jgi:hypothetical protein
MKASPRVAVSVTVVGLALLGWLGYRAANATAVYTYRIDFATLPESDDTLREWLASQLGVVASSVSRDGQTVVVEYVRSLYTRQPLLGPVGEAKPFGYGGVRGYTVEYKGRW